MDVALVETPEGLAALEPDWGDLLRRSGADNIFLTSEWIRTWWQHYGGAQRLFTVAVRDPAGQLVALAPLKIARRRYRGIPLRCLEFVGSGGEVSPEHLDWLLDADVGPSVLPTVLDALMSQGASWDVMHLTDLREGSPTAKPLLDACGARGLAGRHGVKSVCPYVALPADWPAYLHELSPADRYNVGRRCRALERAHRVEFAVCRKAEDLDAALTTLFRLHAARWGTRGEVGSFARHPENEAFHRAVARRFLERGWLRLFSLAVDGQTVAALLGYEYAGRLSYYQAGFDPAWSRMGVGVVLLARILRDAIERGVREFDFLRGDEAYKLKWTQWSRTTEDLWIWNRTAAAALHRHLRSAVRWARRRMETMPFPIRRGAPGSPSGMPGVRGAEG